MARTLTSTSRAHTSAETDPRILSNLRAWQPSKAVQPAHHNHHPTAFIPAMGPAAESAALKIYICWSLCSLTCFPLIQNLGLFNLHHNLSRFSVSHILLQVRHRPRVDHPWPGSSWIHCCPCSRCRASSPRVCVLLALPQVSVSQSR